MSQRMPAQGVKRWESVRHWGRHALGQQKRTERRAERKARSQARMEIRAQSEDMKE